MITPFGMVGGDQMRVMEVEVVLVEVKPCGGSSGTMYREGCMLLLETSLGKNMLGARLYLGYSWIQWNESGMVEE